MALRNTRGRFSKAGPSTRIPGAINFDESDSAPVPLAALGLASTELEANPLQEEPQHSSTPVHIPTPLAAQVPLPAKEHKVMYIFDLPLHVGCGQFGVLFFCILWRCLLIGAWPVHNWVSIGTYDTMAL